jgi:hypothetical protein
MAFDLNIIIIYPENAQLLFPGQMLKESGEFVLSFSPSKWKNSLRPVPIAHPQG